MPVKKWEGASEEAARIRVKLERFRERRNDDPGEAHAADDDRPERRRGVRVLVGTVARPGNLWAW